MNFIILFWFCFISIYYEQHHILSDDPTLFKWSFLLILSDYDGMCVLSLLTAFVLHRGKTTVDYILNCCFNRSDTFYLSVFLIFYLLAWPFYSSEFILFFLYWLFILSILNLRYANYWCSCSLSIFLGECLRVYLLEWEIVG